MSQMQASKRSFDRWSSEETCVLINAYGSRRGAKDLCVPLHIRSSSALVPVDWGAVASEVTSYRVNTTRLDSCRTYLQCKKRMKYLKKQYMEGLASRWPFYGVLHAVLADEVGDRSAGAVEGGGAPAGCICDGATAADEGGSAAGNANKGTTAVDDFVPSGDERGSVAAAAAEGFVPAGYTSRGSAVEVPDGAVVIVDTRGNAFIHEDVKFLSDMYEKKRDAEGASGGAFVDGRGAAAAEAARRRAAFVPPPMPKRARSAEPAASSANMPAADLSAGSADAVVITKLWEEVTKLAGMVTKLAGIYKQLRTKELDVEREKVAAAQAGAGRRA